MKSRWGSEKSAIGAFGHKAEIEALQFESNNERETDYGTAAQLKYGRLPDCRPNEGTEAGIAGSTAHRLLKEEVTAD